MLGCRQGSSRLRTRRTACGLSLAQELSQRTLAPHTYTCINKNTASHQCNGDCGLDSKPKKIKICEQTTSCTLRERYLFPVQFFQIAQKLNAMVNNSVEHIIYMFTLLQKIHIFTLVSLTFYYN